MSINFLLLQINDAAFPIGSYTQSYGLETYIQQKKIYDKDTAFLYIKNYLLNSFLYTELLSAHFSYDYGKNSDFVKLKELDNILRATKVPLEIRNASEKLGRRFVKTVLGMQINVKENYEKYYTDAIKSNINHCTAYGFLCGSLNLDKNEALRLFIYQATSALVTNCVKTIPLSQIVGQKLLSDCYDTIDTCLEKINIAEFSEIGLSIPAFDIRCMQHETLYSRLYMS